MKQQTKKVLMIVGGVVFAIVGLIFAGPWGAGFLVALVGFAVWSRRK